MKSALRSLLLVCGVLGLALLASNCGGSGGYGDPPMPPPAPPGPATITLAAPVPQGLSVNRSVNLSADVTAPAGVTRVEFLVDGTVVGSAAAAPYMFAWDTSAVPDGSHTVTARVVDAANNTVTSADVPVTVTNHPTINVTLTPDEVFPRPQSTASGTGQLVFDLSNGAVTGGVNVTGVTATAAHIHDGFAGSSGPVIIPFVQSASDASRWEPATGSVLTADQIADLLNGKLYVNVHSAAYPDGEIRGQIRPDNIRVVFTALSPDQVVPPAAITASGTAATTFDAISGNATVHLNTAGLDDATEAHVHKAAADSNATAALFSLTRDPTVAGHWAAELQPTMPQDRTDFDANNWYVDVHTPAFPNGAIRGQITPNPAPPAPPPAPAVTLSQLQDSIFGPRCSSCHTGTGASLPGSMNLTSAAATFAALVNVPSQEQPQLPRVAPGNPDGSYVVLKIEGAPGITGSRMPLGGPFLSQPEIDQVRAWIAAGAQNN